MNRPSSYKILHYGVLFNLLIAQNAIGVIDIFVQFEIRDHNWQQSGYIDLMQAC